MSGSLGVAAGLPLSFTMVKTELKNIFCLEVIAF